MNRFSTQDAAQIMERYVTGAEIEYRAIGSSDWHTAKPTPEWNWACMEYRIKPAEPKCVPYTKEDMEELLARCGNYVWFKFKNQSDVMLLISYDNASCNIGGTWVGYESVLDRYTHLDGTPAGKLA